MTVKQLIKELKKLPQNLKVYHADHDHGDYETSGDIGQALLINKAEMTEVYNDKDFGRSDVFTYTPKKYVVLRP